MKSGIGKRKVKKTAINVLTGGNELTPQAMRSKILRNRNTYKKVKYHINKIFKK